MLQKKVIFENARGRGAAFARQIPDARVIEGHEGERLPSTFDLLVITGGPMSADLESRCRNPHVGYVFDAVREVLRTPPAQSPRVLGVCLGKQVIAEAMGVRPQAGRLVRGWVAVSFLGTWATTIARGAFMMEYHRNHLHQLPEGASLIARSSLDPIEGFICHDGKITALGFHPELTPDEPLCHLEVDAQQQGEPLPPGWSTPPDPAMSRTVSKKIFEKVADVKPVPVTA